MAISEHLPPRRGGSIQTEFGKDPDQDQGKLLTFMASTVEYVLVAGARRPAGFSNPSPPSLPRRRRCGCRAEPCCRTGARSRFPFCPVVVCSVAHHRWSLMTGHRSLVTDHWSPITGHRSLVTDHWSPITAYRPSSPRRSHSSRHVAAHGLQDTSFQCNYARTE